MEQRFIDGAKDIVKEMIKNYGIEVDLNKIAKFLYGMFRADMSDSYSVTLKEQKELIKEMFDYLVSIGFGEKTAVLLMKEWY